VTATLEQASKIGLFVFNQGEDYHRRLAEEAEQAARQYGVAVEVFDAGQTAVKQAQDLVRFALDNAGQRLCALVVPFADATSEGAIQDDPTYRVARRVLQKGMGWVMLNHGRESLVEALRIEFPGLPVALVAIDNVEFGRIQARQLRALLPPDSKVLCVRGNPFDSGCQERSEGLQEGLLGAGLSLEEVDGRWDAAVAETAVHRWITSPLRQQSSIQAVVAQNDLMAVAARNALIRASRELGRAELRDIPILGGDGLPGVGQRWVDEGTLTATVSVTLPGKPAVEMVWRHWRDATPLPAVTRLAPKGYPR
jgi:ABC-type sugar transport system substrate-binding protein